MTEAVGSKVQEAKRQASKPESQVEPAQIGAEWEPRGPVGVLVGLGGVSAPPIVPPNLLRSMQRAGRGVDGAQAGYAHYLQRLHGNRATHRYLRVVEPSAAARIAPSSPTPMLAPLGPAPDPRRPIARAADPAAIQRGLWGWVTRGASAVGGAVMSGVRAVGSAVAHGATVLFEQAMRAAGVPIDAVMGLLRRAGAAFERIIANPGQFLSNLLTALKGGFERFAGNIGRHLQAGLIGWLTGTLGGAGIRVPRTFDLAGIFDLALQVLGVTVDRLRDKVGRVIGAQNVRRIEAVWTVVARLVAGGLGGLWDLAKDYVGNLYDLVIGQVKDWAITRIVQQAVVQIISMFNPAGAVVQVIRTIWNIIQFLRERGAHLWAVFQRLAESVAEIASGNVGGAVSAIERTLASAVAPLLGLLGRLVGLGDIAGQVRRIIEAVRAPIDRALDRVIGVIARGVRGAAGALGRMLGRGGQQGQAAAAETQAQQEQRLRQGVQAGVTAFNRHSGRMVGEAILRPLLTAIRVRYRLAVLEPVVEGDKWAVRGEVRRMTVPTGVPAPTLTLPIDLDQHENVNGPGQGHTKAKHVGMSTTYLRDRLKNQPAIPAATSFRSLASANTMVNLVLTQKRADVQAWLTSPASKRAFDIADAGLPSGVGVKRPAGAPTSAAAIDAQPLESFKGVRVVAKKGGPRGWYVLTAHPL